MHRNRGHALVLFSLACALARATPAAAADEPSLLQMIAEWQYPGSKIAGAQASDGATVDASGRRTVPSIACKAVMTTDAPVDKVIDYYRNKLSTPAKADGDPSGAPEAAGRSVVFSDDSEGRPFALHTVVINAGDAATTLVISRGKDEAQTYIAWKHYRRFGR